MPYKLVKSGKGYYVENKDTGKRYSNKPIPLTNAKKQMKVLYMHSKGELGGEFQNVNPNDLEGAGLADFLKKAYNKIAQKTKSVVSGITGRVQGVIMGRNDYPPAERDLIQKYGDKKVVGICAYREPLDKKVNTLVNTITLGKFNDIKDKYSIDELYHLYMVVTLEGGIPILVEKNEVINIHEYPNIKPNAQKFELTIPPDFNLTFKQMLDAGQAYMGNDWFTYDAIKNNCQRFIMSILNAQPELIKANPDVGKFVQQDTSGLDRDLSKTSKNLFNGITGLASRLNVLAKGYGFNPVIHK
jgi:hypothetical protein